MSTEPITQNLEDDEFILPCYKCGVDIRTRRVVRGHDDEGNYVVKMTFDRCADCAAILAERIAQSRQRAAEARAKYEKSLADLLNHIPKTTEKQIGFDMGLD